MVSVDVKHHVYLVTGLQLLPQLSFKLVRRSDNKEVPIKYHAETAFTFHFVNCFEDEGQLVVDFCGYSSLDILDDLYLERLDSKGHITSLPMFRRYVLPLSLDQVGHLLAGTCR